MSRSLAHLTLDNRELLTELETRLNHRFNDRQLLQRALVHSSYGFEQIDGGEHNETLEFLGDAVLDLTVGHLLFSRFPGMREGKLTKLRAALVHEGGLARMARDLELSRYLLLGRGEDASGGREKASILSCAYEAVVGAFYLDAGYEATLSFVQQAFEPLIRDGHDILLTLDAKSSLQEILQEQHNEGPSYQLDQEEGPAHSRVFTVSVRFRDAILGRGQAPSKKEAEQQAAAAAIRLLQEKGKTAAGKP